ncbi:MAG: protein translocase subunit SecF, partial [Treponema sp.]|nr:protein translocase subunit SecF [Treponema sp.]
QSMGQPSDRHFLIRVQAEDEAPALVLPEEAPVVPTVEAEEAEDAFAIDEYVPEAAAYADNGSAEVAYTDGAAEGLAAVMAEGAPTLMRRPIEGITSVLESYWPGQVVVLRSDFVGSRFAGHLTNQVGILIFATLLLVLLYATIRFRLQYAVGAVLGIIHDGIIVVAFVVITRMEFNTTTIAAILTILGYSTNNTIVVFDRIREKRRLYPEEVFVNILNRSLSETLNRTIITTVTTMLAVMSLFIFTTGAMQDFALALMVGMVSGVYTTTFIVTAFMNFWENKKLKKARQEFVGGSVGKPTLSKA